MYTRGQFAVMGNVGRKALRLYHEEGLLVPVYTNEENGYHYYSEEQLADLDRIKRLRKAGLSLYEVRQILEGRTSEQEIIESRIHETNQLLRELKEYEKGNNTDTDLTSAESIDTVPFDMGQCIYVAENVEREDLGMSIGKLYEKAAMEGLEIRGDHFTAYDGADGDDFSMKTCLPISAGGTGETIEIHEKECIHTKHTGGFSTIWKTHRRIRRYAEEKGIALTGRVYEVYHKDMSADVYYVTDRM